MQNNHTQNCKGSGCWLQRFVRCHSFNNEGLRVKTAPFVCPTSDRIFKTPLPRKEIYTFAPGSDASRCRSVKWWGRKSPEKLVRPVFKAAMMLGLIAFNCAISLSRNGLGRAAASAWAIRLVISASLFRLTLSLISKAIQPHTPPKIGRTMADTPNHHNHASSLVAGI
jgi:hypothetical protein